MEAKEAIKTIGDWISKETHKRKYDILELAEVSQALIYLKKNTEQLNSNWIPVSEKLPIKPNKHTEYLASDVNGTLHLACFSENLYQLCEFDFHDKKGIAGFYTYESEYGFCEVDALAWRYLPTPYKEDNQCKKTI